MYLLIVFLAYLALLLPYNYITADHYIELWVRVLAAMMEVFLIYMLYLCIKRVNSLPYIRKKRKKQRKAAERRDAWIAREPERKEAARRRTTIVSTYLISKGKKRVGNVLFGGVVGGVLGGKSGATLFAAMAYHKNSKICTFLVKYLDGHTEKKEATEGSLLYKEYMKYLVE